MDERAAIEARVTAAATGPAAAFTRRTGTVEAFDDHVGAGTVRDGGTGEAWTFHCTRVADGSRTIAPGPATWTVAPGPVGLEAVDVRPA